jgi:hypothetical protein
VRRKTAGNRWRRTSIRMLGLAVILMLAGASWLVIQHPRATVLTFNGHRIDQPELTLRTAEQQLATLVASRHGAHSASTRCYYTTGPLSGQTTIPVTNQLACGPVLFIDGDMARPYLTFDVEAVAGRGGVVRLSVRSEDAHNQISGPEPGRELLRPDRLRPPAGTGGLAQPPAPPSVGNVLTRTTTVGSKLNTAPPGAVMIGRTAGVQLVEYGFVDRYGVGDLSRSAPPGCRLLAFSFAPTAGETGAAQPMLSVRIGGVERGPLVLTSDYVVTAVPKRVSTADLVLTDTGTKQVLSLITGQPDSGNPRIGARVNRSATLAISEPVTIQVKGRTGPAGLTTGTITFTGLTLSYWAPDGSHASGPDKAFLHVLATVRLAGDPQPYGAEAALLWASGPGASRLTSRNAAQHPASQVDDVIEVPATITSGTLNFSGTATTNSGTMTVVAPVRVPFHFATG